MRTQTLNACAATFLEIRTGSIEALFMARNVTVSCAPIHGQRVHLFMQGFCRGLPVPGKHVPLEQFFKTVGAHCVRVAARSALSMGRV